MASLLLKFYPFYISSLLYKWRGTHVTYGNEPGYPSLVNFMENSIYYAKYILDWHAMDLEYETLTNIPPMNKALMLKRLKHRRKIELICFTRRLLIFLTYLLGIVYKQFFGLLTSQLYLEVTHKQKLSGLKNKNHYKKISQARSVYCFWYSRERYKC